MKVFIVLSVLLASTLAAPGVIDNKVESDSGSSKMMQYFGSCFDNEDFLSCLTVKGITALNRAARAADIKISDGITLARDPSFSSRAGKAISENEIVSSLPSEPEQRSARLYDMALETINNFFSSHSLQVKFPAEISQEVSRAFDEGRGKKLKKLIKPLLLGLIGKKIFALAPLLLIGLALLAFKALVVSKIALLLAVIVAASKLGGGGGGGGGGLGGILGKVAGLAGGLGGGSGGGHAGSYANTGSGSAGGYASGSNGWSSGGGSSSYPYARSYDDAQDLAYSGQVKSD